MIAMGVWRARVSQPVVLAFEDLHWADPTSLDLVRALGERGAQAPLLILATTRPEFRPPWSLRSHHSVISLAPLDRRAGSRAWSARLARRAALSDEVIEGVSERDRRRAAVRRGGDAAASRARRAEAARRRSRRPCSNRSRRASTGWGRRAKSRRSARCWDGASRIASARRRFTRRSRRPQRPRGSTQDAASLRWIGSAGRRPSLRRGRPAGGDLPFQARADSGRGLRQPARRAAVRRCTDARPTALIAAQRGARSDRPSFHRRLGSTISRSNGGARRATRRCVVRPSRRRSPISARRSRWRTKRNEKLQDMR